MDNDNNRPENIAKGLLEFLKKTGQEQLLPEIINNLKKALLPQSSALVLSPIELSAIQKIKTQQLITKLAKQQVIDINFKVDSQVVDGLKIIVGDQVWDLTMAGQINQLADKLIKN